MTTTRLGTKGASRAPAPRSLLAACTILASSLSSCGRSPQDLAVALEEDAAYASAEEVPQAAQGSTLAPRLMRSGSARIEVADLDSALASARALTSGVQGFVAGSEVTEGREGERTATLTLRIPADSFDQVVQRLAELGRVISVSVTATDVSREYFDAETRLAVSEETVRRLRELASRTGSVEDLLAAERELGRALGELESLKGQLRYYDQRIAESDLSLALIEPGAVIASGVFRPVVVALRDAAGTFAQSVAYLVYIVVFVAPWVVLVFVALVLVKRWRSRRRASESRLPPG